MNDTSSRRPISSVRSDRESGPAGDEVFHIGAMEIIFKETDSTPRTPRIPSVPEAKPGRPQTPLGGAMFIVNRYRPTFPFVFRRGGGRLSVACRLVCARRPAEKQNGNNRVAALGYKHGTPNGVWSRSRNSNAAPGPETARDLLIRAQITHAPALCVFLNRPRLRLTLREPALTLTSVSQDGRTDAK